MIFFFRRSQFWRSHRSPTGHDEAGADRQARRRRLLTLRQQEQHPGKRRKNQSDHLRAFSSFVII